MVRAAHPVYICKEAFCCGKLRAAAADKSFLAHLDSPASCHEKRPERGLPLKIAQVAPLYESVPPRLYGGTERVVSYLTEELVEMGHEVTLFASGDSVTRAQLIGVSPQALRLDPGCVDPYIYHTLLLEQAFQRHEAFDVVHFHIDYLHFPMSRRLGLNQLTTLHGRLDIPDLVPLYREYAEMPLISISPSMRSNCFELL